MPSKTCALLIWIAIQFFLFVRPSSAEIIFEGYYRIEKQNKHIGYLIQRDELNQDTDERTITYFSYQKINSTKTYYWVKSVARLDKEKKHFMPLLYKYVAGPFTQEGTFDTKWISVTASKFDSKTSQTITTDKYKIPITPKTIVGAFLPFESFVQNTSPPKVGAKFTYEALSEELRKTYKGIFEIIKTHNIHPIGSIYHAHNKEKKSTIEYFMNSNGNVLAYRNKKLSTFVYLTAAPKDAGGDLEFMKPEIEQAFGNSPMGQINDAAKNVGKFNLKEVLSKY